MRRRTLLLTFLSLTIVFSMAGCNRSKDDFDNRTLERRPHVETVKPEDKSDPFRP